MRQVRGNGEHFARSDVDLLLAVLAEVKAQGPFQDVGDLLVLVLVARHHGALLQIDVREHHPIARDHPAADALAQLLRRHRFPPVQHGFPLHVKLPVLERGTIGASAAAVNRGRSTDGQWSRRNTSSKSSNRIKRTIVTSRSHMRRSRATSSTSSSASCTPSSFCSIVV